ncbi:hypothetical protein BDZ89DRAFT_1122446 [Hymenopellis radicata]|nr:hypothetical protein BDZ89DRAFT_1122446 [Hymenopellis radicata]
MPIDPSLADPMDDFMNSVSMNRTNEQDEMPQPGEPAMRPDTAPLPAGSEVEALQRRHAFGDLIARAKVGTWDEDAMREWHGFIAAASVEEERALIFINQLDIKLALGATNKALDGLLATARNGPAMKSTLLHYANLHILATTVTAYNGTDNHLFIVKTMREHNVPNIPSDNDLDMKAFHSNIREALTSARSTVKSTIKKSTEQHWDLSKLVEALIKPASQVKATLAVHCRAAFLRWHYTARKNLSDTRWWIDGPDATLAKWRARAVEDENFMNTAFKKMFENDVEEYGALTKPPVSVTGVDQWMKIIEANAAKPSGKAAQGEKQAKKRARVNEEIEEESV